MSELSAPSLLSRAYRADLAESGAFFTRPQPFLNANAQHFAVGCAVFLMALEANAMPADDVRW